MDERLHERVSIDVIPPAGHPGPGVGHPSSWSSPHRRIPIAAPVIGARELEFVADAVRSGWVSSVGAYVNRFERDFAAFVGTRHAVAVSSGTSALHVALC